MLLPHNIRPENSFYYIGGQIIGYLRSCGESSARLGDLIEWASSELGSSASLALLALDWLYLIDAVTMEADGRILPCS